jgi:IS5 family transposase
MAEYGSSIMNPLEDLAFKVLGMSVNTAKRKARSNELPFAAVKLNNSQKAPYLVHIHDLAAYIEQQCSSARIEWGKAQCF